MKVLCAISGVEFTCEHFPATINSREITHPIFYLKQSKLISFISKWATGELTTIDSYLLFLSLLNSTELIDWRVPVIRTAQTDSLIANNMETLVKIVSKINLIKNPKSALPQFVVSKETKTLDNIQYWLQSWFEAIESFNSGYKSASDWRNLRDREAILEKLIKSSQKDVSSYSATLADWAETAGSFPRFDIVDYTNTKISLSDYWKLIIRKCCKSESIFEVPKKDLLELIEHCEENIPFGSIYAFELMKLLRAGVIRQSAFLGIDSDKITEFVILDADSSVEDANKLNLINSAPTERPIPTDFATNFLYIKAKLKYDMAQKYKKDLEENSASVSANIQTSVGEL